MTIEQWEELSAEARLDILMDLLRDVPCSFEDIIAGIPVPIEED